MVTTAIATSTKTMPPSLETKLHRIRESTATIQEVPYCRHIADADTWDFKAISFHILFVAPDSQGKNLMRVPMSPRNSRLRANCVLVAETT
jgi:hypothetical protein